ncbi:MAG: hypothetical protein ACOY16_12055 [Chloroflexota bacterium]
MSEKEAVHGLTCPNCGGVVPVPEGQVIVRCPYCEQRSIVLGERGLPRYQTPLKVERAEAEKALQRFLSSHRAIASDAARTARLEEAFVAYLPFWTAWGRVLGWVFGQKRVGSGDDARYEPREVQVVEDCDWNGAACDVGEFGVTTIPLPQQVLEPFNPDELHRRGMVFEPVNALSEAQQQAEAYFHSRVERSARLDRVAQVFVRLVKKRFAVVYHPLWVLRYLYRGRAFQVAVDGHSGQVLYGKAPGNTLYRAAVLVGGMALGAFLAIDLPALLLYLGADSDDGSGLFALALFLLAAGFVLMGIAYRTFRFGEQYEYRQAKSEAAFDLFQTQDVFVQIKDVQKWIDQLN